MSSVNGIRTITGALNTVNDWVEKISAIYLADLKREMSIFLEDQNVMIETLETGSKIFKRKIELFSNTMKGAIESSFSSITEGVQEGAYKAAHSTVDLATKTMTTRLSNQFDKFLLSNKTTLIHQEADLERLKIATEQIGAGLSIASDAMTGIGSVFGPVGGAVGGIVGKITNTAVLTPLAIEQAKSELEIAKLKSNQDLAQKQLEALKDAQVQAIETVKDAANDLIDFTQKIEEIVLKVDEQAKLSANSLGLTGKSIERYKDFFSNAAANLSFTDSTGKTIYLNRTQEEMTKMQQGYVESSGRQIGMSRADFIKASLLGEELGDQDLATSLLGDMDYFNQTIENSTDMIHRMFIEANKAGVSNSKFAKDLQQNLKLAQKYTFKGGVEALMKMSVWAQKTRFDMQGLQSAVDKVQTGGIEGIITQSANLQVLGGNMAAFSDPLGMMYDAFADTESYAKRMNKMVQDIGRFDARTGQTHIGIADRLRLQAYSNATGISMENAIQQVNQRVKNEEIDRYLANNGGRYTENERSLIYSKAQYDTESGKWVVNINDQKYDIDKLGEEQIRELMPVEERIEDHVSHIMSDVSRMAGVTAHGKQTIANETAGTVEGEFEKRMDENQRFYKESLPTLIKDVVTYSEFVTQSNQLQHEKMLSTSAIIDRYLSIINGSLAQSIADLTNGKSALNRALNAVSAQVTGDAKNIDAALNALAEVILNGAENISNGNIRVGGVEAERNAEEAKKTRESSQKEKQYQETRDKVRTRDYSYIQNFKDGQKLMDDYSSWHRSLAKEAWNNSKDVGSYLEHQAEAISADIIGRPAHILGNIFGVPTDWVQNFLVNDGVVSAQGSPIVVGASDVTPIQDGSVKFAKSDPSDSAVFAKAGGPIDRLIGDVYNKVDNVYNTVSGSGGVIPVKDGLTNAVSGSGNPFNRLFNGVFKRVDDIYSNITPSANFEVTRWARPGDSGEKPFAELPVERSSRSETEIERITNVMNDRTVRHEGGSIEVKFSGRIDLQSGNQSVDITNMMRSNPNFIRTVTEMVSNQFSSNANGGKHELFPNRFTMK